MGIKITGTECACLAHNTAQQTRQRPAFADRPADFIIACYWIAIGLLTVASVILSLKDDGTFMLNEGSLYQVTTQRLDTISHKRSVNKCIKNLSKTIENVTNYSRQYADFTTSGAVGILLSSYKILTS